MSIVKQFEIVKSKIQSAAVKVARSPFEIELIAISKKQPIEKIKDALTAGQRIFGENYVQELLEKIDFFSDNKVSWHFVGGLQRNKCKMIVGKVDLIHSVDRFELASEISKIASAKKIRQKILIEVNMAEEDTKHGVSEDKGPKLLTDIQALPGIEVKGLMCLPPLESAPEDSRKYFKRLRVLSEKWFTDKVELSMGTSHDYEIAIEEGATMVRVGTILFGSRE